MIKASILFLRSVIVLVGIGVLFWIIRFPQTEGRAKNLDLISIYVDPFIIYGYIASIAFFMGLYQAFKLLGQIEQNKLFSPVSVKAVNTIKYCAMAMIGFVLGAEVFILWNVKDDDPAGAVAMGIFITVVSTVIATAAHVFQKQLENSLSKK